MAVDIRRGRQVRVHPADHVHQGRQAQADRHLGGPDGDRLVAITQEQSWKVKRIRNTPRVTIAECDRGGKPKGEAVEAVAAILDKSANGATYDAIGKRYGLLGKMFNVFSQAARRHEEQRRPSS